MKERNDERRCQKESCRIKREGDKMTTARASHVELDRAYVLSKVIEANLERLTAVLGDTNVGLREELRSFTRCFGRYVETLGDACVGGSAQRARDTAIEGGACGQEVRYDRLGAARR